MIVRPFKTQDAAACVNTIQQNKTHIGDLYSAQELTKAAAYNQYWVAEDPQHQIVGLIGFTNLQNGIGMVATFAVNKNQQGKGIGTKLLKHLKKEAQKQKFRKLLLLTHEKNKPMMILAIKEDFIPEGSLKKHFRDGKKDVIYFSYFVPHN